jgi:hypothetical protein
MIPRRQIAWSRSMAAEVREGQRVAGRGGKSLGHIRWVREGRVVVAPERGLPFWVDASDLEVCGQALCSARRNSNAPSVKSSG